MMGGTHNRFLGQRALVTGAGGGIGLATCKRLAAEGADIIAVDRSETAAHAALSAVREQGGRAETLVIDQADPNAGAQLTAALTEGRVPDVAVCCAGIQTFHDTLALSGEAWDEVFDVNARGTFLVVQAIGQAMTQAGVRGSIVTIASIQGRLGNRHYAHYAASKAAVLSLTKSWALTLAGHGVRVNAVAPGIIATQMWVEADRELAKLSQVAAGVPRKQRIQQVPLGREGTPDDVAAAATFLASTDASYITGECLHVCGGDLML